MIFNKKYFTLILIAFCFCKLFSQSFKLQKGAVEKNIDVSILTIKWHTPLAFEQQGKTIKTLSFEGVSYINEKDFLPVLQLQEICKQGVKQKPIIQVVATESLTPAEEASVSSKYITENFEVVESYAGTSRKVTYMFCKLFPVRQNKTTGKLEKLISYRLQWQSTNEAAIERNANQYNKTQSFVTSSVLATGTWYKIGTAENAVYKIDYALLHSIIGSTAISSLNPQNIKIYGNGGEILSELNSDFHYDDLTENAIFVKDTGTIGVFDNDDYILFYGQSPNKWHYAAGKNVSTRYTRNKHYYSDSVFYFLTVDNGSPGKRINTQVNASAPVTNIVNSFDDYTVHEIDATNLVISGREMYGENFDNNPSYSFPFTFPYLQNDTIWLQTDLAGRTASGGTNSFNVAYPGGQYPVSYYYGGTGGSDPDAAGPGNASKYFLYTQSTSNANSSINISISNPLSGQTGWLNYIWIIVRRALTMAGSQMTFRDYRCIGTSNISQFNIQSAQKLRVWDITDMFNISELQPTFASNNSSFTVATDTLKQFIAFDGTSFKTPAFVGQVINQNLHSLQNKDYIIIAPKAFYADAQKLADLHANPKYEGLSNTIVTPDEIYNEFSSGVQDIMAIRQFMRMLYKNPNAGATPPKYLLLFGTGSYRQKDRYDPSNTVIIPTFETYNSYSFINSKTGDDFYALLDDNEGVIGYGGDMTGNVVDLGVGRLVVKSVSEADGVTNKIIQYYNRSEPTASCCDQSTQNTPDWRNWICLIADDANVDPSQTGVNLQEMQFLGQQETNAGVIQTDPRYNVDKIYEDAYTVETVPGGRRYPDVNAAINNRIAKGCLIMGYSGHGGELNLSHEDIIDINQIFSWTNINNLPLFFTATCEFSRYDNPAQESAGEDVLLNPNGGGIALFTTTRLAYVSDGGALGGSFYSAALGYSGGKRPALGDIIRITKIAAQNELHFSLLGDPAVTLSYPKQNTGNISINNHAYQQNVSIDTLSALAKYKVVASVTDLAGNKLTSFNGNMYITVFDKPALLTTLNNSQNLPASSYIVNFYQQKSVIYKGKSVVTNGDFSYEFIVPKDIAYNFGGSKISYYAQSDTTDAAGYNNQIVVGGTSSNPIIDHQGPGINLFMNDNHFVSGGTTNQSPFIYALLTDSSGINTSGNGLGHDITAILDANTPQQVVLNDYYQADLNKYQSGKILYQLQNLSNGNHTLNLKAWDVVDNSSVTSTDFVVATNAAMALTHVLNYPNPFTTATKFFVEHNQACDVLNVEVQIYTITGKVVKTILQTVQNQGFRTEGISWDGRDDFGDKLARGVYIYKVLVKNSEGSHAQKIEKLVILN